MPDIKITNISREIYKNVLKKIQNFPKSCDVQVVVVAATVRLKELPIPFINIQTIFLTVYYNKYIKHIN